MLPSGIESTGWPAVEDQCRKFGDEFDEWQAGAGRAILAKRSDGMYAATVGGVVLSIPRQVAKTFLVLRIIFALCVMFPGLKVLWTAHHGRTITNTFRSMQSFARRKAVAPHVAHVRTANGEQEVRFANDSVIMFGAREQGFGRGFDEVDVEVFDEAQILTEKALEDMVAATNQFRHPHGALLFYMGTPPRPTDPSEAFTAKRAKALSGQSQDMVYIECSADENADPDDRAQWAKANPSFPNRTPLQSMLRLRENLPSDDAWLREALGIWGSSGSAAVINVDVWAALKDQQSNPEDPVAFAVDVAPDRSRSCIAIAGRRPDGKAHLEVVDADMGTGWVADRLVELTRKWAPCAIVIDPGGPAGALLPDLERADVDVLKVTGREYAQSCGAFYDATAQDKVRHLGDPRLNVAVSAGRKRPLGDAWAWHRRDMATDITPLVAVTLALHGLAVRGDVKKKSRAAFGF